MTFGKPLITNKHLALPAEKTTPPAPTVFQVMVVMSDLEQDLIHPQHYNIQVFRVMNMEKSQIKKAFLHFIIIIIMSTLLGYLSHDLMNGVNTGFFVGIGFATLDILHKSN